MSIYRKVVVAALFAFVFSGVLLFHADSSRAQQQCTLNITKVTEPASGTVFTFDYVDTNDTQFVFDLSNGDSHQILIPPPTTVADITEEPVEGYVITDITCDTEEGITVTQIEGGIEVFCESASGVTANCTITNTLRTNVPTLSEWGMISAAAGLGLIGVFFVLRKRRAQASA